MTATATSRPLADEGSGGRHRPATDGRRRGPLRTMLTGKSGPGVRHDLEGLRAIAVLGVVVFHLRASWLPGGFAGVDVFFVLSGYFITGLLLREIERSGTVDLRRFWGRRARRLLPASALVVVVTVLAGWQLTNPLEAQRIAKDGLYAGLFGMNWHTAWTNGDYFQDPDPSPLVHYWSLGVEEQFYLVWPLLLLLLAVVWVRVGRRRWASPRRVLVAVSVVVGTWSFLLALAQTRPANSYAYFGTFERVWQLALGGALAALAPLSDRLPPLVRALCRWAGVALIVAFYVGASVDILYPGRKALVPAFGAALVVVAGEPLWRRRDPLARVLCATPAQLGGRYSYGWYLWHYPPLVVLPIALDRPLRVRELGLVAVGTVVAAVLTYHLLENPVRSSRRLAVRHGGRSLALGAALIVLAAGCAQATAVVARHDADHSGITTAGGVAISPQPGVAAKEYPVVYGDGCILGTDDDSAAVPSGTNPDHPGCRYRPDTGHGDVVLVGDSHAAMWFSAVDDMAAQQRWGLRFWARNSCPFADVTKLVNGPYRACDAWRATVVKALVAARPSLVIVASLDSGIPPLYRRAADGTPTTLVGGHAARQLWEDGMTRTLRALTDAGIKVLLIHDTPGYPKAMPGPDCVLAHPDDVSACSLPQAQAMPGAPNDLGAAARVGRVSTIDYTDVFCRRGRCAQVVDATLAYRDYNHLTDEMVARLRPALTAAAAATLRGEVVHPRVAASQAR